MKVKEIEFLFKGKNIVFIFFLQYIQRPLAYFWYLNVFKYCIFLGLRAGGRGEGGGQDQAPGRPLLHQQVHHPHQVLLPAHEGPVVQEPGLQLQVWHLDLLDDREQDQAAWKLK